MRGRKKKIKPNHDENGEEDIGGYKFYVKLPLCPECGKPSLGMSIGYRLVEGKRLKGLSQEGEIESLQYQTCFSCGWVGGNLMQNRESSML